MWFFVDVNDKLRDFAAVGDYNLTRGSSGSAIGEVRCLANVRRVPAKARYYKHPCGSL